MSPQRKENVQTHLVLLCFALSRFVDAAFFCRRKARPSTSHKMVTRFVGVFWTRASVSQRSAYSLWWPSGKPYSNETNQNGIKDRKKCKTVFGRTETPRWPQARGSGVRRQGEWGEAGQAGGPGLHRPETKRWAQKFVTGNIVAVGAALRPWDVYA